MYPFEPWYKKPPSTMRVSSEDRDRVKKNPRELAMKVVEASFLVGRREEGVNSRSNHQLSVNQVISHTTFHAKMVT